MDNLEPITRNEMFLNGDDLEPITREEMILAGADLDPITRHEWFLKKYRGGGGGGEYDLVNIPDLPADIASFNDGTDLPMASLKVSVTPYQDLHGYDAPWAGGAGKNKFADGTISFTRSKAYSCKLEAGTYTLSALVTSTDTDATTCLFVVRNSNNQSLDNGRLYRDARSSETFTIAEQADNIIFYASDSNAHSTDDTATWTDVQIELGSTATTFAPYSNICPIIGWDEAVVTRCGKNLCDSSTNIVGFYSSTGNFVNDGTKRSSQLIKVNPNEVYIASIFDTNDNSRVNGLVYTEWDKNGNFIQEVSDSVITTTANTEYIRIRNYSAQELLIVTNHYTYQLEHGSTATSYEPYNGQTYTIDLDGTRYGGVVDATNGTMTVDRAYKLFDGSDTTGWRYSINYGISSRFDCQAIVGNPLGILISNMFVKSTVGNDKECISLHGSDGFLILEIHTDRLATNDVAGLMNYFASNNLEICYELATPITVQLAPQPVKSIEGENNISANCGQITEVKYFKRA